MESYQQKAQIVASRRNEAVAIGTKRRDEIYRNLVVYLTTSFDSFVHAQDSAFTDAQRGREAKIKQLVRFEPITSFNMQTDFRFPVSSPRALCVANPTGPRRLRRAITIAPPRR